VTIEGHTATHKPKDWLSVPRAQVEHNFAIRGLLDDEQLVFVEGQVEQTLLEPQNLPERICYLRLDTDFYTSTKAALKVLYPRLESGGALVIDDYGWWRGAQKATDEYFSGEPAMEQIDRSARLLWKPHG
jgi:O-methyltransferase